MRNSKTDLEIICGLLSVGRLILKQIYLLLFHNFHREFHELANLFN